MASGQRMNQEFDLHEVGRSPGTPRSEGRPCAWPVHPAAGRTKGSIEQDVHPARRVDRMRLLCFSDLHCSASAAKRLATLAASEDVDAMLSAGDLATDETHEPAVYEALAAAGKPILSVPGNHDGDVGYKAHLSLGRFTEIDGKVLALGGVTFAGWGIRWMDSMLSGPSRGAQAIDSILALVTERLARADARCTVFLTHLPPWGTRVARDAQDLDHGNVQLRRWIETFQPAAVVCGHVHHPTARTSRIGNTVIVNGGPYGYLLHVEVS
jgi:Icc-related predicted phosphoesterase